MTGQELREWRRKWGLSQEKLAQPLGVFRESVARWETGARAIPSFLPLTLEALEHRMKPIKGEGGSMTPEEEELLAQLKMAWPAVIKACEVLTQEMRKLGQTITEAWQEFERLREQAEKERLAFMDREAWEAFEHIMAELRKRKGLPSESEENKPVESAFDPKFHVIDPPVLEENGFVTCPTCKRRTSIAKEEGGFVACEECGFWFPVKK